MEKSTLKFDRTAFIKHPAFYVALFTTISCISIIVLTFHEFISKHEYGFFLLCAMLFMVFVTNIVALYLGLKGAKLKSEEIIESSLKTPTQHKTNHKSEIKEFKTRDEWVAYFKERLSNAEATDDLTWAKVSLKNSKAGGVSEFMDEVKIAARQPAEYHELFVFGSEDNYSTLSRDCHARGV